MGVLHNYKTGLSKWTGHRIVVVHGLVLSSLCHTLANVRWRRTTIDTTTSASWWGTKSIGMWRVKK